MSHHRPLRMALVHDWLVGQRGGEQVLERLLQLYPNADVHTLVHAAGSCATRIEQAALRKSFVQHLPLSPRHFRMYLPLFFAALGQLDVRGYDIVISSSHCVALGVRTEPWQTHVAYVHSPMRYLYDQLPEYLPARARRLGTPLVRRVTEPLRRLDHRGAARPDVLLANSHFVAARIARAWGRPSAVVPPPVDTDYFAAAAPPRARRGLLCVAALVAYKRVDALIDYANASGEPLTIVGKGPLEQAWRRRAGPTVQWQHGLSRASLRALYARSEAFVFAGEEDAGIAPIEALAAGCPVVALQRGGVPEAVGRPVASGASNALDGPGGVLFKEATPSQIAAALGRLRCGQAAGRWPPHRLRQHAADFSAARFDERIAAAVAAARAARIHA